MNSALIVLLVIGVYVYFSVCKCISGYYSMLAREAAKKAVADPRTSDKDLDAMPSFFYSVSNVFLVYLITAILVLAAPIAGFKASQSSRQRAKHSSSYVEFQKACFRMVLAANPIIVGLSFLWIVLWFVIASCWRYLLIALTLSANPSYSMDIPSTMARVITMPQQMISRICHR